MAEKRNAKCMAWLLRFGFCIVMVLLAVLGASVAVSAEETCSEGLVFRSNGDGTCYVSGLGTCTDQNVRIPSVSPDGDAVTAIGDNAFKTKSAIRSVTVPNGVTTIGSYAFYYCTSLEKVILPETLTEVGNSAFRYCMALKEITLPAGVKTVGNDAFSGCSNLESVTLPDGLTSIGASAFYNCFSLSSVTLPEGLTVLEKSAFRNCYAMEEIRLNATAMTDLSAYNYVFYNAGMNGKGITVTVAPGVTAVPAYLFCPYNKASAPRIVGVTFEKGSLCERIGDYAFRGCESLASVVLRPELTQPAIGDYAFQDCRGLTTVDYFGTEESWGEMKVGSANESLLHANVRFMGTFSRRVVPPTCTERGYTEITNLLNGDVFIVDYVPAVGHNYLATVIPPTCTEAGYTAHTCPACGDRYADGEVASLGHSYGDWSVTRPSTCSAAGEEGRDCGRAGCTAGETRPLPLDPHNHDYTAVVTPPTCTVAGYTTHTCGGCGHSYVTDELPAAGHTEETVPGRAPTATESGLTDSVKCSVCGSILVPGEVIPALVATVTPVEKDSADGLYKAADGTPAEGLGITGEGTVVYCLGGVPQYAGAVSDGEGYFYYINSESLAAVRSELYPVAKDNGLLPKGYYKTDDKGRLMDGKGNYVMAGEAMSDGLKYFADSTVLYYRDGGVCRYAGLVSVDGAYYYVGDHGEPIRNCRYFIINTNGLTLPDGTPIPVGVYEFDEEGRMTPDIKNGLVDGVYYENNGTVWYAGLILWDGKYYYVGDYGRVISDCTYYITNTHGLLPGKAYDFDENGILQMPEVG